MNRAGFTLLEVVLALALLGLLVAASGPLIARLAALGRGQVSLSQAELEFMLVSEPSGDLEPATPRERALPVESRWIPRPGATNTHAEPEEGVEPGADWGFDVALIRSGHRVALRVRPSLAPGPEKEASR